MISIEKEIRKVSRSLQSFVNATIIEVQAEFEKQQLSNITIDDLWIIEKKFACDIKQTIYDKNLSKIKKLQYVEYLIVRHLEGLFDKNGTIKIYKELDNLLLQIHNIFYDAQAIKLLQHFNTENYWMMFDKELHQRMKSELESFQSELTFIDNRNDTRILTDFMLELISRRDRGIFVSLDQHFLKNRNKIKDRLSSILVVRPLYYNLARITISKIE